MEFGENLRRIEKAFGNGRMKIEDMAWLIKQTKRIPMMEYEIGRQEYWKLKAIRSSAFYQNKAEWLDHLLEKSMDRAMSKYKDVFENLKDR